MSESNTTTPKGIDRTEMFGAREGHGGIIRCDACPVLCRIRPGRTGACDRYANEDGRLIRTDALVLAGRHATEGGEMVPFLANERDWDGNPVTGKDVFVTGIGSGTTYPDYKPAPFIVSSDYDGVDTVTVVTEGIFSYCGVKVKIDTDRHIGPGDGRRPCRWRTRRPRHHRRIRFANALARRRQSSDGRDQKRRQRDLPGDDGALQQRSRRSHHRRRLRALVVQAGKAPIIDGIEEQRMRVGCGSATIGIFAQQWFGEADELSWSTIHITGVLSEHQAGKVLNMPPSGIKMSGRRSTPGRYFQVAEPGSGWGGTDIKDPLAIIEGFDPEVAWPGMRLLMTSTTGEDAIYCVLDDDLRPVETDMPHPLEVVVDRIGENCEPSLSTVLFMGGAGGSLRAGVTENPVHRHARFGDGSPASPWAVHRSMSGLAAVSPRWSM